MMLFSSRGLEYAISATGTALPKDVASVGLCSSELMPAGWKVVCVGELYGGVLKSGPTVAVLSLEAIVLLMIVLSTVLLREIPPPAQPALLLTITLLLRVTVNQELGRLGLVWISPPLT